MKITTRRGATAFFIALGCALVAIAVGLNITWIIHWRSVVPVAIGVVLFALIIAGLIVNTIFVVREIRRNEQYDSFLNAVTHELRTPVASIRLYLETLQSRKVTDAQRREFYQHMLADTDRLMGTVDQVLRAAETTQKRRERNWTPVDIAGLMHECAELARARHQLPAEALTEKYSSPESAATTVLGDPDELRIAIANVLDNAVKYSPGRVRIHAEVLAGDQDVLVRISDKGVGIPPADLKRIFKRFFRTGRARTKVKGTGLGLFIVRNILRKHRGGVVAESEGEGKGATITLRLPELKAR
ncbi:MAG: HAMP domain-containing sensor histidine kinase [Gammaproteobacteria bacterium]